MCGLASGEALPAPAKCPEVDLKEYLPAEKTYLDRCSELALVAAAMALREGGLLDENHLLRLPLSRRERGPGGEAPRAGYVAPALQPERIGLGLGTAYGCLDSMYANTQRVQTRGARMASPLLFMHSFVNAPASLIAIEWGLQGPGATFTDGGLSAASALYWACDLLRRGEVDMMLVGGVEALSDPLLKGASPPCPPLLAGEGEETQGPNTSVPEAGDVSGPPWEAAAFFLLERAGVAQARGARALAAVAEVTAPTAFSSDPPSFSGRGRGGGPPFYAFGAHFALLLARALGDLADQPAGSRRAVEEAEGRRMAKTVLLKP